MLGGGYGLGVFLDSSGGHRVEMHSGGWETASAQLTRILDEGLTVVVLTNAGGQAERPWWGEQIAGLVTGKRYLPSFDAVPDPDSARTARVRSALDAARAKGAGLGEPRSLGFVRAVPQGSATLLMYRGEFDQPMLLTLVERGGKIEYAQGFRVPRP